MKVETLVQDIYSRVSSDIPFNVDSIRSFASNLALRIGNKLGEQRGDPELRMSNMGTPCRRKLWYSIKHPEYAEPLPPWVRLKFLFGDILEELLLFLARESGHTVTHEQHEVEIDGVRGHIDGLVDGELLDAKSASSLSFQKFQSHGLQQDDAFGYLVQLGGYGSRIGSGRNHFLAIDKQHGHITLDSYDKSKEDFSALIKDRREILSRDKPPPRDFTDEPFQESGNRKLKTVCSYCAFRKKCWPGVRTFVLARDKVLHLTVVTREPKRRDGTPTEVD